MKRCVSVLGCLAVFSTLAGAAVITDVRGTAAFKRPSDTAWQRATRGTTVSAGDTVRCGASGRMDLKDTNGHRVRIWARSQVTLTGIDGVETKIVIALGRMRAWVKKLKGREKFEVKTPVAVCSVRGTEFEVDYGEDKKTRVEVYEGQVAAKEELTGSEVIVGRGQYTQVEENQPPADPKPIPEKDGPGEGAGAFTGETKDEVRREIFQEISREAVLAQAADEIKLAEYQNGKSAIDASGNRVRMEEYIVRTQPKEFKYVVLNTREAFPDDPASPGNGHFNFGKMVFTFNDDLPQDLTLATRTMFSAEGATKPTWLLRDVVTVMSNTQDQVNEIATGGDMFADNPAYPRSWTLGFADYAFYVNDPTATKPWWRFTDGNHNGSFDAGEITYFDAVTGLPLAAPTSAFSQPGGANAFHFLQRDTYGPDQWIAAEDFVINDDGTVLTREGMQEMTSAQLEKAAYDANFERIYTSSAFGGRKIDLVFSAKLLMDSGMLNLPDLKSRNQ